MSNSVISSAHFHHIALKVSDFERSLRFYTEGLGLTPILRWGEGDGSAVMLDIGDGGCIEMFAGGKSHPIEPDTSGWFFHLAIGTDDPDGAFRCAVEAGAREKNVPFDAVIPDAKGDVPLRIAFVYGPDGEIIEFFSKK